MSDEQKPVIPESGGVRSQLSRKQVLEIQERADKATSGPWKTRDHRKDEECIYIESPRDGICSVFTDYGGASESQWSDAQFIAASRTDVPALTRQLDQAMESSEYIYQGHLDHVSPCSCVHCKRYRAYYGDEGGSNV